MTIAIDISMLVYAGSGVARYTFSLAEAVLKFHPEHTYKLFYSSRRRPAETVRMLAELRQLGARIYDYPLPPWLLKQLWNTWHVLPVQYLIGSFDVFHSSDFLRPPLPKDALALTTVHDLTWHVLPDRHEGSTIAAHRRKLARTVRLGDLVILDSKQTRQDLITAYAIDPSRLSVLPLGIDSRFLPAGKESVQKVRDQHQLPEKYIVYVGAIEPRKRLDLCVRTFAALRNLRGYHDYHFVIAGRAGWKNEAVFELIKQLGLTEVIHFIGYVDDDDLPSLYTGAAASLYLSEYEGFGLPPLESLACGTPVLASATSSVVEFVPARYLSHSVDPVKLARQLQSLTTLKSNQSLIDINQFSWQRYADSFIALIEQRRPRKDH